MTGDASQIRGNVNEPGGLQDILGQLAQATTSLSQRFRNTGEDRRAQEEQILRGTQGIPNEIADRARQLGLTSGAGSNQLSNLASLFQNPTGVQFPQQPFPQQPFQQQPFPQNPLPSPPPFSGGATTSPIGPGPIRPTRPGATTSPVGPGPIGQPGATTNPVRPPGSVSIGGGFSLPPGAFNPPPGGGQTPNLFESFFSGKEDGSPSSPNLPPGVQDAFRRGGAPGAAGATTGPGQAQLGPQGPVPRAGAPGATTNPISGPGFGLTPNVPGTQTDFNLAGQPIGQQPGFGATTSPVGPAPLQPGGTSPADFAAARLPNPSSGPTFIPAPNQRGPANLLDPTTGLARPIDSVPEGALSTNTAIVNGQPVTGFVPNPATLSAPPTTPFPGDTRGFPVGGPRGPTGGPFGQGGGGFQPPPPTPRGSQTFPEGTGGIAGIQQQGQQVGGLAGQVGQELGGIRGNTLDTLSDVSQGRISPAIQELFTDAGGARERDILELQFQNARRRIIEGAGAQGGDLNRNLARLEGTRALGLAEQESRRTNQQRQLAQQLFGVATQTGLGAPGAEAALRGQAGGLFAQSEAQRQSGLQGSLGALDAALGRDLQGQAATQSGLAQSQALSQALAQQFGQNADQFLFAQPGLFGQQAGFEQGAATSPGLATSLLQGLPVNNPASFLGPTGQILSQQQIAAQQAQTAANTGFGQLLGTAGIAALALFT